MKSPLRSPPRTRFEELDVARFVAAMSVVLFHYLFRGWVAGDQSPLRFPQVGPWFRYGYLGVQFFFMISGFVILLSAQGRSAASFARARFLRLYPAYWFAVLLTSLTIVLWGAPRFQITPVQVLVNLTMLQQFLHVPHIDGVYWTLTYELVFYTWLWVLLANRLMPHFSRWCSAVLLIATLAHWIPLPGWARVLLLADYGPYFIAGAFYFRWAQGALSRPEQGLLAWAAALTLWQAVSEAAEQSARYGHTEMATGTIVLIILGCHAFFLLLVTGALQGLPTRTATVLGAITYPLYLIHQNIGYVAFNQFQNIGEPGAIVAATIAIALFSAHLIATHIEPTIKLLIAKTKPTSKAA